jgi:hypothetical protein
MSKLSINPYSSVNQRVIDGLIAGISFWLAYQAMFEGCIPALTRVQMWLLLPAMAIGRVCANHEMFIMNEVIASNASQGATPSPHLLPPAETWQADEILKRVFEKYADKVAIASAFGSRESR